MTGKRIYVYRREDGAFFADYSREYAERNGQIVNEMKLDTRGQIELLITSPGALCPDRVRALAERAFSEIPSKDEQRRVQESLLATAAKKPLLGRAALAMRILMGKLS